MISDQFIPTFKYNSINFVNTFVFGKNNTIVAMDTLAKRLTARRDELGLTQEDLAIKAKVSQGTIGHLESGRNASSRKLPQIAHTLGVNALWLSEGKGPKYPGTLIDQDPANHPGIEPPTKHQRVADAAGPHYHVRSAASQPEASPTHDNQELVTELLGRRIPPHIQQSILTLLQACEKAEPAAELSEWDKMTARKIDELRAAVPPEQQQVIDDFRDMFLHGYVQPGPKRDLIAVVSLAGDAADHDADDDQGHAEDEKKTHPK